MLRLSPSRRLSVTDARPADRTAWLLRPAIAPRSHHSVTTKPAPLRVRVRQIVERPDGPGRTFDLVFQALIVLSLVAFLVETEPGLPAGARAGLEVFEVFTVLAFSLEYGVRLWVAPRPLRFVFSFWGIVDLLAILPFYLGGAIDLRSIRVLGLVRVFRLARYGAAAERLRRAFVLIRAELTLFAVGTSILVYLVSVGIYYCERAAQPEAFGSLGRCLWWAIVTLTTVGYGDAYPITAGGRIFTSIVLLLGLGVVAIPSGMVASALSEAARGDHRENSPCP